MVCNLAIVYCDGEEMQRYNLSDRRNSAKARSENLKALFVKVKHLAEKNYWNQYYIELVKN